MAPIVHHIHIVYKEIYQLGRKIPKRDKLGLHRTIEELCLSTLTASIRASLSSKQDKSPVIREIRIAVETLKYLIRVSCELRVIEEKHYVSVEGKLQEISKMAVGWERYITKQPSKEGLF